MFEPMGIRLNYDCAESITVIFEIVDIKNCVKITEDFVYEFHQGAPEDVVSLEKNKYHEVVTVYGKKLSNSLSNACIFSLNTTNDTIYLVGRFYKSYTTSFNVFWDNHLKCSGKNEATTMKPRSGNEKVKKYLMPIGFSFKQMFVGHKLNNTDKFSPVIRFDSKNSIVDLCNTITEYQSDKTSKTSTISFELDYKLITHNRLESKSKRGKQLGMVTTSYEGIEPFQEVENKVVLEIENLKTTSPSFKGYPLPINILFVELVTVNLLNMKSSIKVKNFTITVDLFDRTELNGPQQLPLIFDRTSSLGFTKMYSSAVIFDCLNPCFIDDFKILLPPIYMPNLHLFFTFRSVDHREKVDKKNSEVDYAFGYSWIKVFDGKCLGADGEHSLPIVTSIPANYLSYNLETFEKGKKGSDLKFVDANGKHIFKIFTNHHSNYHTTNSYLIELIQTVTHKGITETSSPEIIRLLKVLESLESSVVIIHLYVILEFLFFLFHQTVASKIDENKSSQIQKCAMRVILRFCGLLRNKHRESLLRGYAMYRFDPSVKTNNVFIHEVLLENLHTCFLTNSEPALLDNLVNSFWFFLEVIIKCFTYEAVEQDGNLKNRKNLLKSQTIVRLKELIALVTHVIKDRSSNDFPIARKMIAHISSFINKCFSLIDRGVVMSLLDIVIENLTGNDVGSVQLRFEVLLYLANYKNFVQLNLPLENPANKNGIYFLKEITSEYALLHFPLYLIFSEVTNALELPRECREFPIRLMLNLAKKHHFDDRYAKEDMKVRIHMMYLPFLTIVARKCDLLIESADKFIPELPVDVDINQYLLEKNQPIAEDQLPNIVSSPIPASVMGTDRIPDSPPDETLFSVNELRDIYSIFFQIIKCVDTTIIIEYLKCFSSNPAEKFTPTAAGYAYKKGSTEFIERFIKILRFRCNVIDHRLVYLVLTTSQI
ncbi:Dedicator of cytokinesis protein 9 [Thelohanellus kitauei]|uniref:Dedicator of cytokinesis protein 9 n=1 Tax=Thelohanellus kitauei TaxID=669202 RepID=A0A0C2N795_THEKT|nr:Dedicator of cytokinesis protein 9 [Thelohanellus kitauei]